jgi:hypothetical protein
MDIPITNVGINWVIVLLGFSEFHSVQPEFKSLILFVIGIR